MLYEYFLLFLIYSFMGWLMEVILSFIQHKKFINRGFLIGPYCPIYGCGCLFMIMTLKKYLDDPLALFIMSTLSCSILEYVTSYIMEKIFHARWWDYSDKKFNINGRICLETLVPFGVLGCLVMYIINPFFTGILNKIPNLVLIILSIVLFILFIVDLSVSFKIIYNFKNTTKKLSKDNTEEITNKVRNILANRSILNRRLVNAFPKLKIKKINIKLRKE